MKRATRPPTSPTRQPFIVALGGSAGGLEAFEVFFKNMPPDSGMSFVVVAHLDPTHKGVLPELLQRSTKMPVAPVTEGQKAEPNRVYVIQPNCDLTIERGRLRLIEPSLARGLRMPIDYFLRRLAEDQGPNAVAVIMSGMATDGTLGLKSIKEHLGMVMAQSPESAKFAGMPTSAAATGLVDYIGPPDELPRTLVAYASHVGTAASKDAIDGPDALARILTQLREATGHDFSYYKMNTIERRVERRIGVHRLHGMSQYIRYVQRNPQELELLLKELLIGVTNFFRDPDAFVVLKEKVIPALLKSSDREHALRVWTPGCSTGEEAYSLAIAIAECQSRLKTNVPVQIFATDIDRDAIDKARRGLYPGNISADVSTQRLQGFFTKEDGSYRVRSDLREMVVFAPQNLIMDPPFTKLGLLTCRNLLIYMSPEMQRKLMPVFHYALNPGGYLMLGSSESISSATDLFTPIGAKFRVFKRKASVEVAAAARKDLLELPSTLFAKGNKGGGKTPAPAPVPDIDAVMQRLLLDHHTPPAVLINDRGEIVFLHGRTGRYLEPPIGKASMNLFAMARPGLGIDLAGAVRTARATGRSTAVEPIEIKTNGDRVMVGMTVIPVVEPKALKGLALILFRESPMRAPALRSGKAGPQPRRVALLEKEVVRLKRELQSTFEGMETSQEDLRISNEEMQSANEEMQSTNEELTTSKEEMQSLNEELLTVNAELQNKLEELSHAHDDMKNLLNSTDIATIYLDNDLRIKRYTPHASGIIRVIATDIGRPISDLVSMVEYDEIERDAREVLDTLAFKERKVRGTDERWFTMRIAPYRTAENHIGGVVLTFVEITDTMRMALALREREGQLRSALENMPIMMIATGPDHLIAAWNAEATLVTGYEAEAMIGNPDASEILYPNDEYRRIVKAQNDRLGDSYRDWETEVTCKDGTVKTIAWFSSSKVASIPGWSAWTLGVDVTELRKASRPNPGLQSRSTVGTKS